MLGHIYIVLWTRLTNGDAIAKLRRSIQATNLSLIIGIISVDVQFDGKETI